MKIEVYADTGAVAREAHRQKSEGRGSEAPRGMQFRYCFRPRMLVAAKVRFRTLA